MGFEIVCDYCSTLMYAGHDLRFAREVLKQYRGKCGNCERKLSKNEFDVEFYLINGNENNIGRISVSEKGIMVIKKRIVDNGQ